jgi:hypothetical protein
MPGEPSARRASGASPLLAAVPDAAGITGTFMKGATDASDARATASWFAAVMRTYVGAGGPE